MITSHAAGAPAPLLTAPTTTQLRPRYEGSNICTWIGFKHVNYLVEEAVLEHFRQLGARGARCSTSGTASASTSSTSTRGSCTPCTWTTWRPPR